MFQTTAVIDGVRERLYRWYWDARDLARPSSGLPRRLRFLHESQRWPRSRLDELRDHKLRVLVAHAWDSIPRYRRLMEERGVTPEHIRTVADLPRLPILTKDELRAHGSELRAVDVPDVEENSTGGTTGTPTRVARDPAGTEWQRGCYWRGFGWGGLTLGRPWVQLFGGSLGVTQARRFNGVKNWLAGKTFLPAFELTSRNVERYVAEIRASRARHLVGYTSACHLLATLVERAGLRLELAAVFPTAEMLPPQWAEKMESVFGARVLPYYGCGEVQSLGYTCPEAADPVYHTSDEHAIIEVEGRDGRASLAGEGAFLVTDLDNRAMPFIRYRNGDAGVLAGPGCSCGRTLGRILRLDGRVNDVLLTTSGETLSGALCPHAFRLCRGVDAFQVVQRRPGHVLLRIVRTGEFDPAVEEARLRKVFHDHLGAGAAIEFEYVAEVPRTGAGKARFVINEHLSSPGTGGPPR
jgi:phenylacetate-CoA ligase